MTLPRTRIPSRLFVALLLLFASLSVGSTCMVVEPAASDEAYRDQSTEQQMEDEEVGELDRENDW
jgi:hypothetical protein